MGPEHFWYGGWWMLPTMMPIVMLVVLFTLLYFVFGRGGFRPPGMGDSERYESRGRESESALEILKKRYARGELTKEEFDRMKKDLLD